VRTLLLLVLAGMLSWNFTMSVEAQPQPAQNTGESAAKKEVLEASEAVDRAMLDKDMSVMAALLSDELEYTNQFGEVLTKAQWLDNIGTEKLKHVTFDHKVADLHIYGDARCSPESATRSSSTRARFQKLRGVSRGFLSSKAVDGCL
jgi:hypothetical protein